MSNFPTASEAFSQNGHHLENSSPKSHLGIQEISRSTATVADFSSPSLSPEATRPVPVRDEWTSLTRELIDTLPQVWTRGLLYFLVLFAAIALPWASLAKVDETGSAEGRLEPQGKTIRVDAPVTGTVTALPVREGQTVKAGQVLVELESEVVQAELQQAQAKLEGALNRVAQLELMKNEQEIAIRSQRLQRQAQQTAQLAQIDQVEQRLQAARRAYSLATDRLNRDRTEVQRYEKLLAEGVVPAAELAEIERILDESQHAVNQSQAEIQQAESGIKQQQSNYENVFRTGELTVLESERRIKELQAQILDTQADIAQTRKQIESLQFQQQQRLVKSPSDGTIFSLSLDSAGTFLQPGQAIAQIAPAEANLIFRAQMPSSESGFLRTGLPVKLKFDAYPFQDYGIVSGNLQHISPDSKSIETPQGIIQTFELEIVLDQPYIETQNKRVMLSPGQTATAEVIIRQRRIIDFILDPFKKLQKGGLEL
ncbi:HlyD family efflux transporter periplasmic adaptor subunit [Oculatella sp. LEGE 06141]|uniref:HlyD family efflux transporter periplasmic adaptor subunit n=1 Tax=Oculatella sp. LEGE 06141 TaxID=1828648 RepID=UPI00187FB015|nr:HlyD family efflux transporter periplasmic adaptor subunit [Oculatella sp. LEGE 06141]MBE9180622.1 HlyD family efflux transporter periplasmic adaptor subunit [Oculatella sp. LEGE 06141]